MNNCTVCDDCFSNDTRNKVICDGFRRQAFHAECVNFNKEALLHYREMPNLQWFCDGCIMQTRSFNVSSRPFNKFNSTVIIPTSSPSYDRRSFTAAKRKQSRNSFSNAKRNRNHFPNAKPNNGSVSLGNRFHKFGQDISANGTIHEMQPVNQNEINNANGSMNEVQLENNFVKSPGANGSKPLITTESTRCDVAQSRIDLKEPSQLKTPPAKSSFAEVLTKSPVTKSPVAETVSGNSSTQPQNDSIQSPRTKNSSPSDTMKVLYVSKFDPSTTEEQIVYYLMRKNVIKSAEEVSCNMLVSSDVDLDMLSFISFKITASSKVFDSMFKAKLWPEGIVFREFENR